MPHSRKESLAHMGTPLLWLERFLLAVGLLCLAVVAFAVIDARWFAFQQGRRFDQAVRARATAKPAAETDRLDSFRPGGNAAIPPQPPAPAAPEGSVIGRIEIPRVGVSALVLEGVAGSTLRRGVGHIPGTALPRRLGNVGLAGHRDSVFRGLKDIRKGDLVTFEILEGTYRYEVDWAQVVDPQDAGVLAASGRAELTLVTCYPFYFVGAAPERFIVRAHLLDGGGPAAPGKPAPATPVASGAGNRGDRLRR
jgi:sortase A